MATKFVIEETKPTLKSLRDEAIAAAAKLGLTLDVAMKRLAEKQLVYTRVVGEMDNALAKIRVISKSRKS